jgi:serine/threonine protein kinase
VHRDLKPANIFMCDKKGVEIAKLLDFGISKSALSANASGPDSDLTLAGTVMGTIQYISPEQATGLPATVASELWALGVVMFEMLSGVCAFDSGGSSQDTLFQIASSPPPQLSKFAPDIPWALAEIVHVLMKREPSERFKDADEFLAALDFAATRLGVREPLAGPSPPTPLTHTASEMRAFSSFALMSSNSKMSLPSAQDRRVRSESQVQKRSVTGGDEDTMPGETVRKTPRKETQKARAGHDLESLAPETIRVASKRANSWSPLSIGMLFVGLALVMIALVLAFQRV